MGLLLVVVLVLNVIDYLTTVYAVEAYGVEAEANVVVRGVMSKSGVLMFALVKIVVLLSSILVAYVAFGERWTMAFIGFLAGLCVWSLVVVVNNISVLFFMAAPLDYVIVQVLGVSGMVLGVISGLVVENYL